MYENGSPALLRIAMPNPGKATATAPLGASAIARETGKCANAGPAQVQHAATPSAIRAQRGLKRAFVARTV